MLLEHRTTPIESKYAASYSRYNIAIEIPFNNKKLKKILFMDRFESSKNSNSNYVVLNTNEERIRVSYKLMDFHEKKRDVLKNSRLEINH